MRGRVRRRMAVRRRRVTGIKAKRKKRRKRARRRRRKKKRKSRPRRRRGRRSRTAGIQKEKNGEVPRGSWAGVCEMEERSLHSASQPIHRNESEEQKRWLAAVEMTAFFVVDVGGEALRVCAPRRSNGQEPFNKKGRL